MGRGSLAMLSSLLPRKLKTEEQVSQHSVLWRNVLQRQGRHETCGRQQQGEYQRQGQRAGQLKSLFSIFFGAREGAGILFSCF